MTTIQIAVGIDAQSLMEGGMTANGMVHFVIELDEAIDDWNFTLQLCDYFSNKRLDYMRMERLKESEK